MKKNILIFVLILILGIMSGCENAEVYKPEEPTENTIQTEAETTYEYISDYEDVLAQVYAFITDIENEESVEGFEGIWEAANALGDEALDEIGYALMDVSGDDVPELLIGVFDKSEDAYTRNEIYSAYTLLEGSPELVLYGWSRSAYTLNDDNSFFYSGSSGAAYSSFGKYYISEYGELVCDDFYFTYPAEDNYEEIEIYHNKTGIFYNEEAERLDMTLDEFWELHETMSKDSAKISGTPFAELDEEIIEKSLLKTKAPNPNFLIGEWTLVSAEVEGEVMTKEESGLTSEITITDDIAEYFVSTEYEIACFEATYEFIEAPLYYGCSNDIWCIEFDMINSDFYEKETFNATLIDENTLLLQHFFPFDGGEGVSYQTYTRK